LIVDDDPLVGLTLKHFLEKADGVVSSTEVTDGAAALRAFAQGTFDIVFLDLELPEVDGRSVLKAVPPGLPVIIVSSHTDFGAGSYEFDVVDYLVKPLEYSRFHRAWQKFKTRARQRSTPTTGTIVVRDGTRLVQLALANLLFVEAESNYTRFVSSDRSLLSLVSLKQLESMLPAEFIRVHRSYIVNSRLIEQIEGTTIKIGTHKVPIGETYREEVLRRFSPVS